MEVEIEANQELKPTENEIVDDNSICNPDSTADGDFNWFGKVPPEIFRIILRKLTLSKFEDVKQTLLNCRAVNPLWKSVIDELLEEKRLDTWRNVELSVAKCYRVQPYTFAEHKLVLGGSHSVLLCPPGVYNGMATPATSLTTSPFPANSLTVKFATDPSQVQSDMLRLEQIDFVDFFVHNGTHLSSLVLNWIKLSPETLGGVLKATPNLQALTLNGVSFKMDLLPVDDLPRQDFYTTVTVTVNVAAHCCLPPLPNLRNIRIFNTSPEQITVKWFGILSDHDDFNMYDWILEPYKAQLLSLDVTSGAGELGGKRDFIFPVLKRLSIWNSKELEMASFSVPQLEVLCIGEIYDELVDLTNVDLGVIQGHLARFSGTLVELHLDWYRDADTDRSYLQHYRPESGYRWSRKKVVFLKLKTLSIIYPTFSEELEALKDMLGVMPKLETLNFLRFNDDGSHVSNEEDKIKVNTLLEQENYWQVCPNLKTISARLQVKKEGIFFYSAKSCNHLKVGNMYS